MIWGRNEESDLERRVRGRINSSLIDRKSSEIFIPGEEEVPLATTGEVRDFVVESLDTNDILVPDDILTDYMAGKPIDLRKVDETIGWDIFWAQERAAAMIKISSSGGSYDEFLPGRFLHYDLMAHHIASLFESNGNGGNGVQGKQVVELGSGSGLGLVRLAQRSAIVTGVDYSEMANNFGRYLARHYDLSHKANFVLRDYYNTGFEEEAFDVVFNAGVFEHLEGDDPKKLLEEMIRITRDGGYIVIAVPNDNSPFYKGFKERQRETKDEYPGIVEIPVEHRRHKIDVRKLMEEDKRLYFVKEDGLQVAPSSPVKPGDISKEDINVFDDYVPKNPTPTVEEKVSAWRGLELMADHNFRMRYGWSRFYVAQKQPASDTILGITPPKL